MIASAYTLPQEASCEQSTFTAHEVAGRHDDTNMAEPEVDLAKLMAVAIIPYSTLTAVMHPLNVFKTRAQASSATAVSLSRIEYMRTIIGPGGIRGLFAGVGPVLAGAVPARASYILALESVRQPAEGAARRLGADGATAVAAGHGCAGLSAAMVSMLVYVPVDVVSQKMMVTPAQSAATPDSPPLRLGFMQVLRDVTSGPSGWRGLYRGLGISMVIGLPAGSIWWATYGTARSVISQALGAGYQPPELAQKAVAATAAAAATVAVVAPLDTIKTHHQLAVGSESVWPLALRLMRRDGFLSLYAGSTPRFLHLALWSTCLVSVYEELKRICVREPQAEAQPARDGRW